MNTSSLPQDTNNVCLWRLFVRTVVRGIKQFIILCLLLRIKKYTVCLYVNDRNPMKFIYEVIIGFVLSSFILHYACM